MSESNLGAAERAEVLERRGDIAGAVVEITHALDVQPDSVALLCRRAGLLMSQQKLDQAEVDLRRAAKINEGSADVQLSLGLLQCKRARWREAIAPLELAVDLDPSRASGHYFLAEAYNQTDRLSEALAQYETVVHLEPQNWRALKGVGIVLDKMNRPAEATLAYKKAREIQRR